VLNEHVSADQDPGGQGRDVHESASTASIQRLVAELSARYVFGPRMVRIADGRLCDGGWKCGFRFYAQIVEFTRTLKSAQITVN
jgi:hypothetical protein